MQFGRAISLATAFAVLLITPRAPLSAADTPSLAVQLSTREVRVSNVSSGGEVVLFAASLINGRYGVHQRTGAKAFTDSDGDGVVTYVDARGISDRSVWIAVDVETGSYAIATPLGFALQRLPFPTTLLKKDAEGILGLFDHDMLRAEMLIVRPRVGAWRLAAHEGENGDSDKLHNGKLSLAAADARPVAGPTTPPSRLKRRDVIAVLNPGTLEVYVGEVE